MADLYYSPPVRLSELLQKKPLSKIGLHQSISFNIYMLLTTAYGENRFDPTYGCSIWDDDFENVYSNSAWQEKIAKEIAKTVSEHEKRLLKIYVVVTVSEEDFPPANGFTNYRVKRRLDVRISGNLILTDETFNFSQRLYVSPISLDE